MLCLAILWECKETNGSHTKKKGMTIDYKIEQITTQANPETDYLSSGDETKYMAESSCSEDKEINNTRQVLVNETSIPVKTNTKNADKDDTNHQNHFALKQKSTSNVMS